MLAMDRSNLLTLQVRAPVSHRAGIHLFMAHALGREEELPDPCYGGPHGFERVYRMIESAGSALLGRLDGHR